jgi:hypothetical protein
MKKYYFLVLFCFVLATSFAQVGVNTTTPNAMLEIRTSNEAAPTPTDGLLIPKVNVFPATNPTIAQQGMLVYLTTLVGTNQPGFYFWDFATLAWRPIAGATAAGTLDQAYDFGGAGLGKTITADAGAVLINGTDGFVSTGTLGSGAIAPSGSGIKMFWNPRKAAIRAGRVNGTEWDDTNIGTYSTAFGNRTTASGSTSTAFGTDTRASGTFSTAFGVATTASGGSSTAFGEGTTAFGGESTAFGEGTLAFGRVSSAFGAFTEAIGDFSTAFGRQNFSRSYGETALGIGATFYTPSTSGFAEFRTTNSTDRLFVIGNAIDANNNSSVDLAERSDAIIILKNGLTRLPSTTNAMITAADGKAVVTKEYLQNNTSGTLDQAYDFGGAGLGRTITADNGSVLINGTDGLVSTGTINMGTLAPSGRSTRMVWNPRKAAFRVGQIDFIGMGTEWDDANIGFVSTAFGSNTVASGDNSTAFGVATTASGIESTAFGHVTTASGNFSTAFGRNTTAFGGESTVFGRNTLASGSVSTAFGNSTTASGVASTAFGSNTIASGSLSTAFGNSNTAPSYGQTVIGIGATEYTPSTSGAFQFRTANATDRLFVIGNAIDANNNNFVDPAERSDAIIILKNGLTRLPSTTNAMITAADGKAVVTKEYLAGNSWSLTGNSGTNTTNFIGTTDNVDVIFRRNSLISGRIGVTNTSFGLNAFDSNTTGTANTATGFSALTANTSGINNTANGYNSLSGNTIGFNNTAVGFEALSSNIDADNNTAIGVLALGSNATGNDNTAVGRNALTDNIAGVGSTAVGRDALANSTGSNNTAVGRNSLSGVTSGTNNTAIGFDAQIANAIGNNQVRVGNTLVTLASVQVGWTITSDKRWKSNIKPSNLGLEFVKQLNPVFYTRKDVEINDGKTTILETTTNPITEYGFIAQELESTLNKFDASNNGIISKDDDGMYGVRYNDLIAPLVKAIQEQQAIIEALNMRIEKLENK